MIIKDINYFLSQTYNTILIYIPKLSNITLNFPEEPGLFYIKKIKCKKKISNKYISSLILRIISKRTDVDFNQVYYRINNDIHLYKLTDGMNSIIINITKNMTEDEKKESTKLYNWAKENNIKAELVNKKEID